MINYPAVFTAAVTVVLKIIEDLESGRITVEVAMARIAALRSDRAAADAEANAAALAKFKPNTPDI